MRDFNLKCIKFVKKVITQNRYRFITFKICNEMTGLSSLPELFQIKSITEEYKPMVLRFLREVYYEDEPLSSYLHSTQKENSRYIDLGKYGASCVDHGLSLMAITSSGKIIAIVLNQNVINENAAACSFETNPIFRKSQKLVREVEKQINLTTKLDEKEMRLKIIAIHPDWRSKGIGKLLLQKTRAMAKQTGACQIRSTCTSAYSARMFVNFGFECVYALKYEDYRVNGEVVFKPVAPHTEIKGMVLRL